MSLTHHRPSFYHDHHSSISPNNEGISFCVFIQLAGDGRAGVAGLGRYSFSDIAQALRRFESESRNPRNHRVELMAVFSSAIVER